MRTNRPKKCLIGISTLVLLSSLAACGGEKSGGETDPAQQTAGDQQANDASSSSYEGEFHTNKLSTEFRAQALETHLVPSPGELQSAMTAAGIKGSLATLVPERDLDMGSTSKDDIAIRTGVILADMLFTLETATKEETIARLQQMQEGLKVLDAGDDIPAEMDILIKDIQNDQLQGKKLMSELTLLHAAAIPELDYEAHWTLPMLQAGAWLEGAHLISSALADGGNDAGLALLRQPEVVDYFLRFVEAEGEGRADSKVLDTLKATLTKLKEICSRESMTVDDIKAIHDSTGVVLELLLKKGG